MGPLGAAMHVIFLMVYFLVRYVAWPVFLIAALGPIGLVVWLFFH